MEPNFTVEQLDQMRAILEAHDKKNDGYGAIKEFDLNNPPKKPYRHIEYPKHVGYDAKAGNCWWRTMRPKKPRCSRR